MPVNEYSRKPITIVEIDYDFCELTYGVAPCTAQLGVSGDNKCFNTFATCQDQTNYDRGNITLRFVMPHDDSMIFGLNLLPFLRSVSTSPTSINIGGVDQNKTPLGKRESISVKMSDHPYSDNLVDKYLTERAYNPTEKGTFWSKFIARNPFYQGRELRVLEGYAGQALNEYRTRHYIIESVTTPNSNGEVTIKAYDVMRKTDGSKAKYPFPVSCRLNADIDNVQTIITAFGSVSDWSITDPVVSYGYVRINDEVIGFSSVSDLGSGIIRFNGCTRAQYGTTADQHSENDDVFRCVRMASFSWRIAAWLLKNASLVDPAYVNESEWDDELEMWIGEFVFDALLTESIDVNTLLSELTEQSLFYMWVDVYAKKIMVKTMRPPTITEVSPIDDERNIISRSFNESIDDKSRLSDVRVFFGQRDVTVALSETSNMSKIQVNIDEAAESENQYGEKRIKEIRSRWIGSFAQAITVCSRLLTRYRTPPRYVNLTLDAKDRELGVGNVIDITHRNITDAIGDKIARRFEIISREEVEQGHRIQIHAQLYDYAGDAGARYAFFTPDDYPTFDMASQEQKNFGAWFCDESGLMPDGTQPYRFF